MMPNRQLLGLGLGCLIIASAALAGPPPFTTTTLVAGNNAPLANGTNLLNAIAAAVPPALIKVEPGVYDLGGRQIVMRDLVDIEGSGRDVTTIVTDVTIAPTTAVVAVPAGVEAEIRDLTVRNVAPTDGTGIEAFTSELLVTEVNVEIEVSGFGFGVVTQDASPRLNEVFARVSQAKRGIGYDIRGGGTVITQSLAFVSTPNATNTGVRIAESTAILDTVTAFAINGVSNVAVEIAGPDLEARVENTRGTAFGGKQAFGLLVGKEGAAIVKDSTFDASSDSLAVALQLDNGTAQTTESTFRAQPVSADHFQVFATRLANASNLDANQSNYESTSFGASNTGSGLARFGASQLIGGVLSSGFPAFRCIHVYDGAYNARPANC